MKTEETFIQSYCRIAGVSEAAAVSSFIIFDALHVETSTSARMSSPLAKRDRKSVSVAHPNGIGR